jgi:stage III sporulation protein AE
MLVLVSALGGTASVAMYQPLVLIFSAVIFKIINFIVIPLFYVTFVFGIIGNLSDDLKLEKFAKTSKSAAEWILGIVFSLFITFITAQGITGASIDNLAIRGAKFALSGYVPVVGGQLKEGFDIVVASCLVIKNALGLTSIIVLVFTVILPILRLVVFMLMLKLTAAIIEPVSDKKFSNCLTATAKSITLLIVALIAITFAILIIFMLLIYTVNLGVM